MKYVLVESHGTGYYHELHRANCKDLDKKTDFVWDYEFESIDEVKECYEEANAQYEDGGYEFAEHCKVFPCALQKI